MRISRAALALALLSLVVALVAEGCRRRRAAAPVEFPLAAPVVDEAPAEPGVDPGEEPEAAVRRLPELELAPERLAEYAARRPKSIFELQPYRRVLAARIADRSGRGGEAILVNLQPRINRWLAMRLEWEDGKGSDWYHLQNADPQTEVLLDPGHPTGLLLERGEVWEPCDLWSLGAEGSLVAARASGKTYAPLCGERLYLRNPTPGRKTTLEWATDFLRDNVWRGEQITVFVREQFYQDAFLQTSEVVAAEDPVAAAGRQRPRGAPLRPLVDPALDASYLVPAELGLQLELEIPDRVLVGRWYAVRDLEGVWVSAVRANLVAPEVVAELRGRLNPLDEVESSALVYMVAFDLDDFELGFAVGTEHPRVDWSDRVPEASRDRSLPGPDGISTIAPLVATGMVAPDDLPRLVGTFTGGFKRTHGAFRGGELALRNGGSHYGFIEHGTLLSKLQPGLATVAVLEDGGVELSTWRPEEDTPQPGIRHARQNGVALLEPDPVTGIPMPGELVARWTIGNWSGSVDKRLRTLRAGVCSQQSPEGRFLIYGYFSSATPSAMARVFKAYHCAYAMLLDMNALEHTYLALYRVRGGRFLTQHLIEGMSVLDREDGEQQLPRFVGFADNRDFFYLLRRER